jgi:integrase
MLPIFIIALHTGMRRGEILSLRWENIDFKEREIHLLTSKNGEPRDIAMTNEVHNTLSKLAISNGFSKSSLVFPSPKDPNKSVDIKSTWERILSKAGIHDASFRIILTFS